MNNTTFQAVILDLDGVITQTAQLHAKAWKHMFDEYIQLRSQKGAGSYDPFDIVEDYKKYADGKPRYDGVRSFLESRGIELPEGSPDDEPEKETICGLGNRKNELFHDLMNKEGVEVYEDAVEQMNRWKNEGIKIAVVSSSNNCVPILKTAQLLDLFDAKVDGLDSEQLGLAGKPAPDIFLEACRQLKVSQRRAVIIEDSGAGVRAGSEGEFGLVVGVARGEETDRLRNQGAEVVVHNLRDLELSHYAPMENSKTANITPDCALDHQQAFENRLHQHRLALFLDYDGTLTPIVARPELAQLSEDMRSLLNDLSQRCTVAIISGRDRDDVQKKVKLDHLIYAGSHGIDITGPGKLHKQHDDAQACLPDLGQAEVELRENLTSIEGVLIERKQFAIAIHYRQVSEQEVEEVHKTVQEIKQKHACLRQRTGKKIIELQPDVEWDKGEAVLWLLQVLDLHKHDVVPLYLGDDVTDEDAFRALEDYGIGILVSDVPVHSTKAKYFLRNPSEVEQFLRNILFLLEKKEKEHD